MRVLHGGIHWSYWGKLAPDCLDNPRRGQIAGGETAMLRAAFEMAARGYEIVVASDVHPGTYRGVQFRPGDDFYAIVAHEGPWDAVIVWGDPAVFAPLTACGALEETFRICAQQLNDFSRHDGNQAYVDLYVSPSDAHARYLSVAYGIPRDKFSIIPNGIELSRFHWDRPRDPYCVYSASSPDRGLHHLLRLWPKIKREVPEAHLEVYYETDRWLKAALGSGMVHPAILTRAQCVKRGMEEATGLDVTFHGGVNQQVVIDRACTAGVMAYPCDPICFTEGFATSVLEAWCGGAIPVITDADALGSLYGSLETVVVVPRHEIGERYAEAVVEAIGAARASASDKSKSDLDRWTWRSVGERWCHEIESRAMMPVGGPRR